jgi:hypothetical protein
MLALEDLIGKPRLLLSVYFLIIALHGTANYWAVQRRFTGSFLICIGGMHGNEPAGMQLLKKYYNPWKPRKGMILVLSITVPF